MNFTAAFLCSREAIKIMKGANSAGWAYHQYW